jgi:SAM-dependent methyltransferase
VRVQIHRWARVGFGLGADPYERSRPGYPPEAVTWLGERTRLAFGAEVVDVGAGTGKLTRLLTAIGAHIVAVEPVAEMRRHLQGIAGVDVLAGSAEAIPLPDASADIVTVAEAFHWFRGDAALAEIHRVLRPGGSLALLWNRLDVTDSFAASFHELVERNRGHAPVRDTGRWRQTVDQTTLFSTPEVRIFDNTHRLERGGLADLAASETSIAILPDPRRTKVLAEVDALERTRAAPVVLRYATEVALYERLRAEK